jgi:2-phospho-L-lactate guanylyltransferase
VLSPHQRRQLYEVMLADVLSALTSVSSIGGVLAITSCSVAMSHLRRAGVEILADPGHGGLNEAITYGLTELDRREITGAFTIPGDIPVVTSDEISGLIRSITDNGSVTIVPSHDGQGTNSLAMTPPILLPPRFGHSSKDAHIALARQKDLHLELMPLSGFGFDIDTPADLDRMAGLTGASRTKCFLDEMAFLKRKTQSPMPVQSRLELSG